MEDDHELHVVVEHCVGCARHQWTTRHDEAKYSSTFEDLRAEVLGEFPNAACESNPGLRGPFKPVSLGDGRLSESLYTHTRTGRRTLYPPLGGFEVYANGHLVFSKIQSKVWPSIAKIVSRIRFVAERGRPPPPSPAAAYGARPIPRSRSPPMTAPRSSAAAPDRSPASAMKTSPGRSAAGGGQQQQQQQQRRRGRPHSGSGGPQFPRASDAPSLPASLVTPPRRPATAASPSPERAASSPRGSALDGEPWRVAGGGEPGQERAQSHGRGEMWREEEEEEEGKDGGGGSGAEAGSAPAVDSDASDRRHGEEGEGKRRDAVEEGKGGAGGAQSVGGGEGGDGRGGGEATEAKVGHGETGEDWGKCGEDAGPAAAEDGMEGGSGGGKGSGQSGGGKRDEEDEDGEDEDLRFESESESDGGEEEARGETAAAVKGAADASRDVEREDASKYQLPASGKGGDETGQHPSGSGKGLDDGQNGGLGGIAGGDGHRGLRNGAADRHSDATGADSAPELGDEGKRVDRASPTAVPENGASGSERYTPDVEQSGDDPFAGALAGAVGDGVGMEYSDTEFEAEAEEKNVDGGDVEEAVGMGHAPSIAGVGAGNRDGAAGGKEREAVGADTALEGGAFDDRSAAEDREEEDEAYSDVEEEEVVVEDAPRIPIADAGERRSDAEQEEDSGGDGYSDVEEEEEVEEADVGNAGPEPQRRTGAGSTEAADEVDDADEDRYSDDLFD